MPILSPKEDDPFANLSPGYEGVGEFYDLFADNSDVPFYIKYAERYGSPILDLAAGTGRVTFALAQEGHEVVALEQSQSMLSMAKKRLQTYPTEVVNRITLVLGNMTDFDLDQKFRLIIIPTSFAHAMTSEDQLSTLQCVKEHLHDEGRFILDLFPAGLQYERATFEDIPVKLEDGSSVSRKGRIHSDLSRHLMRIDLRYTVHDYDGHLVDQLDIVSGVSLIFNREADLLIRLSGFEIEEEFGDFEENPYTSESGRRIFILRKRMNQRGPR